MSLMAKDIIVSSNILSPLNLHYMPGMNNEKVNFPHNDII